VSEVESARHTWATATGLGDPNIRCCDQPHIELLCDPESVSVTTRAGRIGPLTFGELIVNSEVSLFCGELCSAYRLTVLQTGRLDPVNRRSPITADAGNATVYAPRGDTSSRWTAGSRMISLKIDHGVVDDALSEVLGRQVTASIDFEPTASTTTGAVRSWLEMLLMLAEQSFRPGSMLTHPLVSSPYVDSLVRGLLLVTDHPHRDAVAAEPKTVAPQCVRAALDIIEAEAHLPLTATTLATRCHVSVRSLQDGFRRHLDTSPMNYLREVRLRRAHLTLQQSDSSTTTVASVAYQWGFTNLGRFAAAHAARYGEPPAITLRRTG
jgi:AraC-like DNA-binding protein